MNELDLSKFCIDFGNLGQMFYDDYLRKYTRRELSEALGHISKSKGMLSLDEVRKGRYVAWRFKKICEELGIDPRDVFEKYCPKIFQGKGVYGLQEVDLSVKIHVQNLICDSNDNES